MVLGDQGDQEARLLQEDLVSQVARKDQVAPKDLVGQMDLEVLAEQEDRYLQVVRVVQGDLEAPMGLVDQMDLHHLGDLENLEVHLDQEDRWDQEDRADLEVLVDQEDQGVPVVLKFQVAQDNPVTQGGQEGLVGQEGLEVTVV